jgi:Cell morphogenesis central region
MLLGERVCVAAAFDAGNWSERIMKSMYYVTQRHGDGYPAEIGSLWRTCVQNERNVVPILAYIIRHGLQETASNAAVQVGGVAADAMAG